MSKYTVRRGLWGSRINTHTRARARGATACGDHRFRSTRQLTGRHAGGGEFVRKSLLPCILCFHACYRCGSPGLLDGFLLFDGCSSSLCFIFSRPIDRRRNRRVEEARQVHISRAQQKCGRKEHVGASSWSLMNHRPGNRNPGFDMNRRRAADAEGMACATRHGKCCERLRIRIATNDADGGSDYLAGSSHARQHTRHAGPRILYLSASVASRCAASPCAASGPALTASASITQLASSYPTPHQPLFFDSWHHAVYPQL